ncbi:MAG: CcmD family protein [bacterium]|nr:CcmD family protein [bacterium]
MQDNYVAMAVTLVVWGGLFFFLMRLDRRVKDLEKRS